MPRKPSGKKRGRPKKQETLANQFLASIQPVGDEAVSKAWSALDEGASQEATPDADPPGPLDNNFN